MELTPSKPHRSGCLICGAPLSYLKKTSHATCSVCGMKKRADARCRKGHFVCDRSHSMGALELITKFCETTSLTDPIEIALVLMRSESISMHGPEHHYLVPAALIAAYCNTSGTQRKKARLLSMARERAANVPGGSCGFNGNCGAAVGTGIFISVVTGATPLSRREWRMANKMTATALMVVAEAGGPRCCKRDSFISLLEAATFSGRHLGVRMNIRKPVKCEFSRFNRECLKKGCRFYPGNEILRSAMTR